MSEAKVLDERQIAEICAGERASGRLIVQCHGCFDGLHIGHVRHLRAARSLGDTLVVSVTADRYVNKGPGRPVFSHDLRMEFLGELACVDWVTLSQAETAERAIAAIRPHFFVKGGEYESTRESSSNLQAELAMLRAQGGTVRFTGGDLVLSSRALLRPRTAPTPLSDAARPSL